MPSGVCVYSCLCAGNTETRRCVEFPDQTMVTETEGIIGELEVTNVEQGSPLLQ